MKVEGPTRAGPAGSGKGPSKVQGGFSLGQAAAPAATGKATPTAGVTGVASIDALLALQSVGTPTERRRKAVGRANQILDILDDVKLSLIDGAVTPQSLDRLKQAISDQREGTEDPRLEGILDEIETRAEVEAAKLEYLRPAA